MHGMKHALTEVYLFPKHAVTVVIAFAFFTRRRAKRDD
jgi:hypothetical protein